MSKKVLGKGLKTLVEGVKQNKGVDNMLGFDNKLDFDSYKGEYLSPALMCDFYKLSHREQYPEGTEYVYSTLVPRSNKYFKYSDKVVVFGIQSMVIKYLIQYFNKNFFKQDKEEVLKQYIRIVKTSLGMEEVDTSHLENLHNKGYLPIKIKAIDEGEMVDIKTPIMTIENTDKEFFWLTNYLETLISTMTWQCMTSATISKTMRKLLDSYAMKTVGNVTDVAFQGHDFSMRGMSSLESAENSGAGHLLSFSGTDTIPSILFLERYYRGDNEINPIAFSIPATEHSVMCANGDYETLDEYETFKRLIKEVYPKGFVSIVSDTWDYWKNLTETLPRLKEDILNRDGRVVIRPDTGNPADIICGDPDGLTEHERKGSVEVLWEIFGGTTTEKGYKLLDSHIGLIYGDSITLEVAEDICKRLEDKGFASTNIVLGVGSYTFQYNTRDTLGFAIKATHTVINGEEKLLFKDPKTGDGMKKSHKGRVVVIKEGNKYKTIDGLTIEQQDNYKDRDELRVVFEDGKLLKYDSVYKIRERLSKY